MAEGATRQYRGISFKSEPRHRHDMRWGHVIVGRPVGHRRRDVHVGSKGVSWSDARALQTWVKAHQGHGGPRHPRAMRGTQRPLRNRPRYTCACFPLADPALEASVRALMREIRCVVCQTRSIDESDADIATNLRNIVREQLAPGKSAATIRDYGPRHLFATVCKRRVRRPPTAPPRSHLAHWRAIRWLHPSIALRC